MAPSRVDVNQLPKQGPKRVAEGRQAVCSSPHPLVSESMSQVMKDGGNAIDAAVAGSILCGSVEPHMTNHAGSVSALYWEAESGTVYQVSSTGTLVPDLPLFRPLPADVGGMADVAEAPPCASIPGFMAGLGAMHDRFGSKPWDVLCQPAIRWAHEGHLVSSFEYAVLNWELAFNTYSPDGRTLFTPQGFTPQVGERFRNTALADTLRDLAAEGPQYFTEGAWAQKFLAEANRLGWPITMEHMTAIRPRWCTPLRYAHGDYEIIQLSPPEVTGVITALVLGVFRSCEFDTSAHYTESAEALYILAHALRRAEAEIGLLNDPEIFFVPTSVWLSESYHRMIADILWNSRPKIDLANHVRLTGMARARRSLQARTNSHIGAGVASSGSCELSIVDPYGNWLQMMNTLQTGGIPGSVVGGVPMVGSNAVSSMRSPLAGWLSGGGRIRSIIGNTLVLRDGHPLIALGTPGSPHRMLSQVLLSILDYGLDPYEASLMPRMFPMTEGYEVEMESRLSEEVVCALARMGVRIKPLPPYDWHMGSFQICWWDEEVGVLRASADPRRCGQADGF